MSATPPSRTIIPTNTLILLLPPSLFAPTLLPLFEAHFGSYGPMVSWTPLEGLGRCLIVYEDSPSATAARLEMDNFLWEDDSSLEPNEPLRAFFGPPLQLPLPPLEQTLLAVPALSRNFLISPPGSPPVGWEQTLEEAPNARALPEHPEEGGWGEELARALRFLSVGPAEAEEEEEEEEGKTRTIVHSGPEERPAITVSVPATNGGTETPGKGARITEVKATVESMLGRRRSFGDLGEGGSGGKVITPTARPPTEEREYVVE